jgi:hypothetical protein
MKLKHVFKISNDLLALFNKKNYEPIVLDIMNLSKITFPNTYSMVLDQSAGQCDFIDTITGEKFDAKLPFRKEQIQLLTDGKKHHPEFEKWIEEMHREAAEFNPVFIRNNPDYIVNLKLYSIMKKQILRDKKDENIVFFLPYPISLSIKDSVFLQFTADYISTILDKIKEEIDLDDRNIYIIYLSSEKNHFVLRSTDDSYFKEYIYYGKVEKYFSHEVVNVNVSEE